ncbi:MAG: hypothetical protein ACE10K_11505 [Rhodothermales bacterium]
MRRESYLASLVVLLLAGALAAGCASTSKMAAPSPVGEWSYIIPTPQGDAHGTIMVASEGDAYSGEVYVDVLDQTVPIEDVTFTDSTFSFKVTLDADGQIIGTVTSMTLNGNTMRGTMEVDGVGEFEITATRKEMEDGS